MTPVRTDIQEPTQGPAAEPSRSVVTLKSPTGTAIKADVVQSGIGPKVIFLHGLVGLNEHWEDVVRRIKHKAHCTTLELPLLELRGDDCSLWSVVDMTTQFLDEHTDGPAVLVGNSFGGHVALRIAHARPDLVRALILAGSSGLIERTMVKGAPVRPSREWLEEKIGELFYDKSAMNPGDVDRAHKLLNERGGARAMVKLSKTARRDNMTDDLGDIACPTLLIWGRQDIVTPPSAGQGFTELMPDARIVWLDGCGHAPMLESPVPFAQSVMDFLDELDQRGIPRSNPR
ncbi:MAG: alpha/beta hydrolase [Phycisphaerales bacterium]|nr:alpha/beta hydrolase [Planctomycetota bacterium]MCH8509170.1 alpha/beta hydrolase [Phycisphaerales bacterium]